MISTSSNIPFKTCVSLLILCFDDLSIGVSGVLKTPILLCSCQFLLLCLLVFVLCIDVFLCWAHRYLQLIIYKQDICSWIDPLIIMQCPSLSLIIFFKVYFV